MRISPFIYLIACGILSSQTPDFTARDMFYSAADLLPAKNPPDQPATKPKPKPIKPVAAKSKVPLPKDAEAHFQAVTNAPLGLRYSILKKTATRLLEVGTQSIFHAGDRIRLGVMSNQRGYLYVVNRNSNGTWTVLFPNAESSVNGNEIIAGRKYEIPGGRGEYFMFDENTGNEKVFILLSKAPVSDLDGLIQDLKGRRSKQLDDPLIAELRTQDVASRDLVFTRTDDVPPSASEPDEKAVYVVNVNSTNHPESRVVADITLVHR